jgi:hypothetical protein
MNRKWNEDLSEKEILIRLKYLQTAVECGIHSGLPACCIRFFITDKMWMQENSNREYLTKIQLTGKNWGYIPCPVCLQSGRVVEVLSCPDGKICFPGDGHLLQMVHQDVFAQEMIDQIDAVNSAFQLIKSGSVASGGAVASMMDKSLKNITILINKVK